MSMLRLTLGHKGLFLRDTPFSLQEVKILACLLFFHRSSIKEQQPLRVEVSNVISSKIVRAFLYIDVTGSFGYVVFLLFVFLNKIFLFHCRFLLSLLGKICAAAPSTIHIALLKCVSNCCPKV